MSRPIININIVLLLCLVIGGLNADAGPPLLAPGQVKLSPPIPVTLSTGELDVFNYLIPFDHPASTGANFHPDFATIQLPNQTLQAQDLVLIDNGWAGACPEFFSTLGPIVRIYTQVEKDKNLFPTYAGEKEWLSIPAKCDQLLAAQDSLEQGTGTNVITPAADWCSYYHGLLGNSQQPSNVALGAPTEKAIYKLCTMLVEAKGLFNGAPSKYSGLCSTFVNNCDQDPTTDCTPFTQQCHNDFNWNPIACRQEFLKDAAGYCGGLAGPAVACLSPQTLCNGVAPQICTARKNFCQTFLPDIQVGSSCAELYATKIDGAKPTHCSLWKEKFTPFCAKQESIAAMEALYAPDQAQSTCVAINASLNMMKQSFEQGPMGDFLKALCQKKEPALCEGVSPYTCAERKVLCSALNKQIPLNRLMVGDVRATGVSNQVPDVSQVTLNAERVDPYSTTPSTASYPPSFFGMWAGDVIGGEGWAEGIVTVLRDPRPIVTSSVGGASIPIPDETATFFKDHGYPAVAFFRFASGTTPPLALHSVSTGFWGPETTGHTAGMCIDAKVGLAAQTQEEFKELWCVAERAPSGVAAVNLFGHADSKARDLVVVNQGPLPFEPADQSPVSYVTIYRRRDNQADPDVHGYSSKADWTDLWSYHGYRKLSGLKPMEHCVAGNDVYIAINKPGKNVAGSPVFYVDRISTNADGKAIVIPIKVPLPAIIAGIAGYGPYGIACGDWNQDQLTDFAITWALLSPDGQLADFLNIVSVYAGKGDGTFSQSPVQTATAIAVKQDQDQFPTPANAEFGSVATCDLNRDGIDDLCVGDQRVYLVHGKHQVYFHYFPFTQFGTFMAGMEQIHQVNTHAKYAPGNGLGGVMQIESDRHGNVAAIVKEPRFYPPLLEIFCRDRDMDGVYDSAGSITQDGMQMSYSQITDPELKAAADAACNIDNCPGEAPLGFKMDPCKGTEKSDPAQHPCFNPSQADVDQDGKGSVCDNVEFDPDGGVEMAPEPNDEPPAKDDYVPQPGPGP